MSRNKTLYQSLLVIACLVLIIQNFLVLLESLRNLDYDEFEIIQLEAVYNKEFRWEIDLIGFQLLAVSHILLATTEENDRRYHYFNVSIGLFFWFILRLVWQYYLLPDLESLNEVEVITNPNSQPGFDSSVLVFMMSSIILTIVGFISTRLGKHYRVFFVYSIINLISSIFIFLRFHSATENFFNSLQDILGSTFMDFLSFDLKFIFIPILAIPAFYLIMKKDISELFQKVQSKTGSKSES